MQPLPPIPIPLICERILSLHEFICFISPLSTQISQVAEITNQRGNEARLEALVQMYPSEIPG